MVTRSAKEEMLQEAVRDVRLIISDEAQAREDEVKAVAEFLVEVTTRLEDALPMSAALRRKRAPSVPSSAFDRSLPGKTGLGERGGLGGAVSH